MAKSRLPASVGPKASALSPTKLRFAVAISHTEKTGMEAMKEAAAAAEISLDDATAYSCDPAVVSAVEELSRQKLAFDVPQALQVLRRKMGDKYSKEAVASAKLILERAIPAKTEQKIETVTTVDTDTALVDFLARLKSFNVSREQLIETFGPAGLRRLENQLASRAVPVEGVVIDAEPVQKSEPTTEPEQKPEPSGYDTEDLL